MTWKHRTSRPTGRSGRNEAGASRRACGALPLSFLALNGVLACGPAAPPPAEPAAVESTARALNGDLDYPWGLWDCDDYQKQRINPGYDLAWEQLHVELISSTGEPAPNTILSCLNDVILGHEGTDPAAPNVPENIVDYMRQGATDIRCRDLSNATAESWGSGDPTDTETIFFGTEFLNGQFPNKPPTRQKIASILLHEVAHTKKYNHPNLDDHTAYTHDDYFSSVPEQVEWCSYLISTGDRQGSQRRTRSSFFDEVTLAKVGGIGGHPFRSICGAGQVALALEGRAGVNGQIDRIGALCRDPWDESQPLTPAGTYGGDGGDPFRLGCYPGELLIGVHGRSGEMVDALGPICQNIYDVYWGEGPAYFDPTVGGGGGIPFTRKCPATMTMVGIRGKSGGLVDHLEIECQSVYATEPGMRLKNAPKLAADFESGRTASDRCMGRSALVGLIVATGDDLVQRLGGSCAELSTWDSDSITSAPFLLPSLGRETGVVRRQDCQANAAVVGLEIRAGSAIDRVRPICANVVNWSRGIDTTEPRLPFLEGGGGGYRPPSMCDVGSFVVGWNVRTDGSVTSIEPICRNF